MLDSKVIERFSQCQSDHNERAHMRCPGLEIHHDVSSIEGNRDELHVCACPCHTPQSLPIPNSVYLVLIECGRVLRHVAPENLSAADARLLQGTLARISGLMYGSGSKPTGGRGRVDSGNGAR